MEELTSTVKNNADNAQQANQLAADTRRLAEKGGAAVTDAVHATEAINGASTISPRRVSQKRLAPAMVLG